MPRIEMDLTDYMRVIRKRKRIIILTFILVLVSTIFYTVRQTPLYQTSCKVKLEQRKSVASILTELITWAPGDQMASHAKLITSYQIMGRVADEMGLIKPDISDERRMAVIRGLQGQVSAERVGNTNMISITTISSSPHKAAALANTTASVYVKYHFENKKLEASNVKQFVKGQLDSYLKQLQQSENALQKFRRENPLVVERDITFSPIIQNDPRVASLKDEIVKLELDLISLESKYTSEHPEVQTLKRRISKAKEDLTETLDQITSQQKELSSKEIELVQLKRDVSIAEDIYLMFKKRYEEARILEAEKAQDVTIVEPAAEPSRPFKPNIHTNIFIGILAGILLGLIMAFVTESFDTSIGRIDDIEELTKVPVLGVIPDINSEKGKKKFADKFIKRKKPSKMNQFNRLVSLFEPSSTIAEAYRSLRTNLDYMGLQKAGKSIVFSSALPQEGKTQTLANLAVVFAQSGQKVLVVGSDFRKPMIYSLFGLQRSPGLSEVLIGKIPLEKAVNTVTDMVLGGFEYDKLLNTRGVENLNIITCGGHAPNPAELLAFSRMDELIQEMEQKYDIVLFDSPPILPVADPSILSTKTDGVVIVYKAGKTPRQALVRSRAQLENVKARIWGVVINNVKAQFIEDVTPYHRYRYYHYKEKK
ncbi:MAG: polysaccharide biosynthesis tyrosine autokinase [Candidatus Aminicenantes bacterium]|nr:polysaccharide biosynthesis tyrosine autokinase [Candidatus Aminicenantes bacterium]